MGKGVDALHPGFGDFVIKAGVRLVICHPCGACGELEAAGAEINVVDAGTAKSTEEDYYTNSQCIGPSLVLGMGSVLNRSDIRDYEENKEAYAKAVAKAIVQWMDNQGL